MLVTCRNVNTGWALATRCTGEVGAALRVASMPHTLPHQRLLRHRLRTMYALECSLHVPVPRPSLCTARCKLKHSVRWSGMLLTCRDENSGWATSRTGNARCSGGSFHSSLALMVLQCSAAHSSVQTPLLLANSHAAVCRSSESMVCLQGRRDQGARVSKRPGCDAHQLVFLCSCREAAAYARQSSSSSSVHM
jgi:hypothetical protein